MVEPSRIAGRTLVARGDAGSRIGYGHVARLEAILDAWTEHGGRAVLRGAEIRGAIRARLTAAGVEIVDLEPSEMGPETAPEDVPEASADDLASTLALARSRGAVAAVIDGYGFKAEYRRGLAEALPLLAVDDLAAFECRADVVLNQNMGFDPRRYRATQKVRLLVGHEYVVLRREFRQAAAPGIHGLGKRVLVTFGGADPAALTVPVVEALAPALEPEDELVVIVGGAMSPGSRRRLDTLATANSGARVEVLTDVYQMAEVIVGSTLAVAAAGSTVWELLACGVPPLAVAVAENQRAVARGVAAHGAGVDLGKVSKSTASAARDAVLALLEDEEKRSRMAARGRSLIDGQGVWRALEALLDAVDERTRT